jgi:hypothetical protein
MRPVSIRHERQFSGRELWPVKTPKVGGASDCDARCTLNARGAMGLILPFVPRCVFDDAATRVMGEAFDAACDELGDKGRSPLVRERMAKRIIEAARAGERDVSGLREAALAALKDQEAELELRRRLLLVALCPVSKGPASVQQTLERIRDSDVQMP